MLNLKFIHRFSKMYYYGLFLNSLWRSGRSRSQRGLLKPLDFEPMFQHFNSLHLWSKVSAIWLLYWISPPCTLVSICFSFNFAMHNHMSEVSDIFSKLMKKIDCIPCHPKNFVCAIVLYSQKCHGILQLSVLVRHGWLKTLTILYLATSIND